MDWDALKAERHLLFDFTPYHNIIKNSLCIREINFYEVDKLPANAELNYLNCMKNIVLLIPKEMYVYDPRYFNLRSINFDYRYDFNDYNCNDPTKIRCFYVQKTCNYSTNKEILLPIKLTNGIYYL